jgi:hypothetical protein
MNRVTAVAATLATAAAATMAAATIGPAMAAPRSVAAHHAAHAKTTTARARSTPAKATAKQVTQAKPANSLPTEIASELDGGKYVTVVRCQGVDSPPPVHLGKPGTPLIVSGGGPSAAISKMLKQADPYKEVYTCTVLVEEKVPAKPRAAVTKKIAAHKVRGCEIAAGGSTRCTKKVTLNTGFGGLAPRVKQHHPAG